MGLHRPLLVLLDVNDPQGSPSFISRDNDTIQASGRDTRESGEVSVGVPCPHFLGEGVNEISVGLTGDTLFPVVRVQS